MISWLYWGGGYKSGVWSFRLYRFTIQLKAPWNGPLFSEREGFNRKLLSFKGWRILWCIRA